MNLCFFPRTPPMNSPREGICVAGRRQYGNDVLKLLSEIELKLMVRYDGTCFEEKDEAR